MTATAAPPLGPLVEEFPITFPDGRTMHGAVHRTNSRKSGRRVVVRDEPGGTVLFDTDECYDSGNAHHKLTAWVAAQIGENG
jgi:hypothetical protein